MTSLPLTLMFDDDGSVPNNPVLPVLLYRGTIDVTVTRDPESEVERMFMANGWGRDLWRDGIYPYTHYHSMIHEVLGIARGATRLRLGGSQGNEVELTAGDVAVLPAGTGHQRLASSADLRVIGGYPPEGTYDLCRGAKAEHDEALRTIPLVPVPASDPVRGDEGPLLALWRHTGSRSLSP